MAVALGVGAAGEEAATVGVAVSEGTGLADGDEIVPPPGSGETFGVGFGPPVEVPLEQALALRSKKGAMAFNSRTFVPTDPQGPGTCR